jgi:tocopherol cyclase
LINFLKKKLNPSCYQGIGKNSQHFEGWYFKIIDKTEHYLYVIIPGVFIHKNNTDSHSFIQIFDGVKNEVHYFKFPINDFHSTDYTFNIQINSNHFSANKIILELKNSSFEMNGELTFAHLTPWPKTFVSPGIMGWYAWVPFMECYHGIVSLDHEIQGSLSINRRTVDFSNGKGYTEKDWGKSFPEAWIWCQSNHFNSKQISFTGSLAVIPWIHKPFLGFIFGLWHEDRLYRFTTYTGAKLDYFEIDDSHVCLIIKQNNLILEIKVNRSKGSYLQAPTENGMTHRITETLKSTIEIKLSSVSNSGNEIIFHDKGRHAGFEIAGNLQRLEEMYKESKK